MSAYDVRIDSNGSHYCGTAKAAEECIWQNGAAAVVPEPHNDIKVDLDPLVF